MPHATLATLGKEVRKHRGNKTLREVAAAIGISPATLMRVESGRVPDVATFGKLCSWLGVDPSTYLGTRPTASPPAGTGAIKSALVSAQPESRQGVPSPPTLFSVSAHFKADQTPQPETINALATLIMYAAMRRQTATVTDGDT